MMKVLITAANPVKIAKTVIGAAFFTSASKGAIMVEVFAKMLQMPMAVPANMAGKSYALAR